mmetsp:Transcript_3672/g.10977  ORF Transcript_3672/g.10977 Transcript_3672/m.10977 type:complete len:507 (+) Transcript_3672:76-1596(+)
MNSRRLPQVEHTAAFAAGISRVIVPRVRDSCGQVARQRISTRKQRRCRMCEESKSADMTGMSAPSSEVGLEVDTAATGADMHLQQRGFRKWRFRVFSGLYISYVIYAVTRATFTFISPTLRKAGILSLNEIGAVASSFPMMYGLSKLLSGFIADNASPRVVLGSGMALTGLSNVGMAFTKSLQGFCGFWGVNGLVQGVGAGAVARVLTQWYTRKERGFWWATWSTSANFGGFVAPILCGWLVANYGWQAGALFPGAAALVFGVIVIPLIRDTPEELSYFVEHDPKSSTKGNSSADSKESFWKIFIERVLLNKSIWLLALSNLFIYFVRTGMRSWHHFYLADLRQISVAEAAYKVSGMELGGLLGTLSSGIISDRVRGSRVPVICAYLFGLAVTIFATTVLPPSMAFLDIIVIGALGFFINGPQCLIGLIGAEAVDRRTVATATGILGWVSYLGAAVAGLPISLTVKNYGWQAYLTLLAGATAGAALLLIPLWISAASRTKVSVKED